MGSHPGQAAQYVYMEENQVGHSGLGKDRKAGSRPGRDHKWFKKSDWADETEKEIAAQTISDIDSVDSLRQI